MVSRHHFDLGYTRCSPQRSRFVFGDHLMISMGSATVPVGVDISHA
jgi:hypothetical protein